VRSDAADSSREKVRMKGGQSREVGSKESQREGVDERRDARARDGWKGGGGGGAEVFADKVKVSERGEKRPGAHTEKKFNG
jgi:hypothetical protein